jgi:hypothetical protein
VPAAPSEPITPPLAAALAFAVVALEIAAVDALRPAPVGPMERLVAALQLVGVGVLIASALAALERARRRFPVPAAPLVFAAATALAALTLQDDLAGPAVRLADAHSPQILPALVSGAALALTALLLAFAALAERPAGRAASALAGLALGAADAAVLAHDYQGVHLVTALVAASLLAFALRGTALPARLDGVPARAFGVGLASAGLAALVVPLPHAVLGRMLGSTGAVVAPFAARLRALTSLAADPPQIPEAARPWFSTRGDLPPTPPRRARTLPPDGLVVLITVDALRADVINSGEHDDRLPNFAAMKASGVRFTEARSVAGQTVPGVTGLFTSRLYSQLYWTGKTLSPSVDADLSPRWPELLRDAGVRTVNYPTLADVSAVRGAARGFVEEESPGPHAKGERNPHGITLRYALVNRLNKAAEQGGPLLLYGHFTDAHAPYTRGGTDCAPFECYLREVALVDRMLGEIRRTLARPELASRAVLVVTADHGEAFGEHGQRYHSTTLYEELLRVPMLVESRLFPAHAVDQPVSLLDLGPTILDLYGVAAPGGSMGQSLSRLLHGEPDKLDRPIAAESGRLIQAMIFPDRVKIIRYLRTSHVELYDLGIDPGEEHNVFDTLPGAEQRLALLDAYFRANVYRRFGYSPPFRK